MNGDTEPHTVQEPEITSWPPAPIETNTVSNVPTFHLERGRNYTISQALNMLAAGVYASIYLTDIDGTSEISTDIFVLVLVIYLLTSIGAALLFLGYVDKAYKSLQEISINSSPQPICLVSVRLAIPIFGLYELFTLVQTLWRASYIPNGSNDEPSSQQKQHFILISLWWWSYLFWILFSGIGNVLIVLNSGFTAYAAILGIIPSALSIFVVHAIQRRQEKSAIALGLEIEPSP